MWASWARLLFLWAKRVDAATLDCGGTGRSDCGQVIGVSAGRGGAHEHGVEPVVIGFVWGMVKGGLGSVQLAFDGFGRLSNGKSIHWLDEDPVGDSMVQGYPLNAFR